MNDGQVMRSMMRDDAYRVVRVLGEGQGGRTELVTLDGERLLVRKRIPSPLGNASAWAALMGQRAPGLPFVESIYQMPDELVVVYSYVEGTSLRDTVKSEGPLMPQRAASVICDVCEAATMLHRRDIVHRDITPNNVILARDRAYLVDLGIARQHAEGQRRDTTTLGTWGFAAPEQYGFAQTDARSDVYSLGRLLGYALTGIVPGDDGYETRLAERTRIPYALAMVVARASAFEPSARYQSAEALARAVQAAVGAVETPAQAKKPLATTVEHAANSVLELPTAEEKSALVGSDELLGSVGPDGTIINPGPNEPPRAVASRVTVARVTDKVGGRRFGDAPLPLRIAFIIAAAGAALWELALVVVIFTSITARNPPWGPAQYAMSVVTGVAPVLFMHEFYQALTQEGPYARKRGVVGLLLQRTCIIIAITFFLMVVAAIVLPGQKT